MRTPRRLPTSLAMPRKVRQPGPFLEMLRPWLERHGHLGTKSGIADGAMKAERPWGFRLIGSPVETRKEGVVIRFRCVRRMAWRAFFERLSVYICRFGHGNALEEAIVEHGFVRVPFMTAGRGGMPCVHCGEVQVDGPGAREAARDLGCAADSVGGRRHLECGE